MYIWQICLAGNTDIIKSIKGNHKTGLPIGYGKGLVIVKVDKMELTLTTRGTKIESGRH